MELVEPVELVDRYTSRVEVSVEPVELVDRYTSRVGVSVEHGTSRRTSRVDCGAVD